MSGPARLHLLLPADAREVRVRCDQPAFLRFRVPREAVEEATEPPTERVIGVETGVQRRAWLLGSPLPHLFRLAAGPTASALQPRAKLPCGGG